MPKTLDSYDATLEEEQARIAAKGPRMPDMGE